MIGVIGGNGVAATNKLCQLIEEGLTKNGAFRDVHHPEMIVWQATQAPSRSMYLEGKGPSWIEDYVNVGMKLKECGCTKLCMCCNTAHYAIEHLQETIGLPFFNLLNLVADKCQKIRAKKVGLMCTDGLRKAGVYEKYFELSAPGVELIYPDEEFQKLVTLGICNAKNSIRFEDPNANDNHPYNCILKVCNHLMETKGVDCIVVGCTDIRNIFEPPLYVLEKVKIVDSLEVLAESIIKDGKEFCR